MRTRVKVAGAVLTGIAIVGGVGGWGYYSTSSPYNAPPTHADMKGATVAAPDDLPEAPGGWHQRQVSSMARPLNRMMESAREPHRGKVADAAARTLDRLPNGFSVRQKDLTENGLKDNYIIVATSFDTRSEATGDVEVLGREWRLNQGEHDGRKTLALSLVERHGYEIEKPRKGYLVIDRKFDIRRTPTELDDMNLTAHQHGEINSCTLLTTGTLAYSDAPQRRAQWNDLIAQATEDISRSTFTGRTAAEEKRLAKEVDEKC